MYSYIDIGRIVIDADCHTKLKRLYRMYSNHKFDLLGSGFVKINYRLKVKGFHGRKYIDHRMALFGKVLEKSLRLKCSYNYEPINWFIDYKSGFFFAPWKYSSMKKCYKVMEHKAGVDIKCPWELGRFYHLVQMAVLAIADENIRESIILEFRDELSDFIETNPVGKTIQWAPMDTSIRLVNLLISYDILRQLDREGHFDKEFQAYFEKHISETLTFVMGHLEYRNRISSNHYLSNIAGIIFAAAYLQENRWTDACLVFGVQELIEQIGGQFYEEGSHFEGSTSYHRLCAEFALFSTALVYGVLKTARKNIFGIYDKSMVKQLRDLKLQKYDLRKEDFFPDWFTDRIYNAGIFTKAILKDNCEVVQVGDNDSGRLVKLTPLMNDKSNEENILDHRTLLSAINGIFVNDEWIRNGSVLPLEFSLVQTLAKGKQLRGNAYITHMKEYGRTDIDKGIYKYTRENVIFQDTQDDLLDEIDISYFDKFGIVVLRGRRIFVSMVIDTAKNAMYLGHTHNDKLSIEVMVDGKYITGDPGAYIYTAFPEIRDKFRSVKAHNTFCIDGYEQNEFNGIWGMKRKARAELVYCARDRIIATLNYGDVRCLREIHVTNNMILVNDFSNKLFNVSFKYKIYSDGYGRLKRVTT